MVIYLVRPYAGERARKDEPRHWQAFACLAQDGRVWTAIAGTPDDAIHNIMSDISFQTAVEVKG